MPTQHESSVYWSHLGRPRPLSVTVWCASAPLAHLDSMEPRQTFAVGQTDRRDGVALIEPALSLEELARELSVKRQALYDLRSQGRGPRGFRVGRTLRFRRSEVLAWLERMEREDDERCHHGGER